MYMFNMVINVYFPSFSLETVYEISFSFESPTRTHVVLLKGFV